VTRKPKPGHESADERVRALERKGRDKHSNPQPVRDDTPEVPDDSQEKQNSSPHSNSRRRNDLLPG